MLSQRLANIVFTIAVIVACIWFAMVANGFEATGLLATSGLPSKFFPQLILGFTGVCALIVCAAYAVRGSAGGDDQQQVFNDAGEARRGLLTLVVAIACYFIWSRFGFVPMAVVMGPLSLLAMGIRSIWIYLVVLALTGLTYLVFTRLLGIQFT
jgi:hypothetical protein